MVTTDQKTYERQANETDWDWEAFRVYRDAGPGRSMDVFATHPKQVLRRLKQVAILNHWAERVGAFDRDTLLPERPDLLAKELTPQERFKLISEDLTEAAFVECYKWLWHIKNTSDPLLSVRDLLSLVEAALKLDKANRGEADQTLNITLTTDDREQLQELLQDREKMSLVDAILNATEQSAATKT